MDEQSETPMEEAAGEAEGSAEQAAGKPGFQFNVSTQQDMTLQDSGAFGIATGRDMQLTDSGAFSIAAGHDMDMKDSGSVIIQVGGSAEMTNCGGVIMLGNDITTNNSVFGILISRQTNLGEGNKVLLGTKQAIALGAAFGVAFTLLGRLLRKR